MKKNQFNFHTQILYQANFPIFKLKPPFSFLLDSILYFIKYFHLVNDFNNSSSFFLCKFTKLFLNLEKGFIKNPTYDKNKL